MIGFEERIARRRKSYWDGSVFSGRHPRLLCVHSFRAKTSGGNRWRCCPLWPRRLIDKWNSRIFAAEHGCRVPKLYWSGSRPSKIPFETLPNEFVVRPNFSGASKGVVAFAHGANRVTGHRCNENDIRAALRALPYLQRRRILVEELITDHAESTTLPTEFGCYSFAGHIAVIEVTRRVPDRALRRQSFYSPAWQRLDKAVYFNTYVQDESDIPAPAHLPMLLKLAARLGRSIGPFMRIDFFLPEDGPVFGEFSSIPIIEGKLSRAADDLLAECWQQYADDQL